MQAGGGGAIRGGAGASEVTGDAPFLPMLSVGEEDNAGNGVLR